MDHAASWTGVWCSMKLYLKVLISSNSMHTDHQLWTIQLHGQVCGVAADCDWMSAGSVACMLLPCGCYVSWNLSHKY
jgi:hypothetical protein